MASRRQGSLEAILRNSRHTRENSCVCVRRQQTQIHSWGKWELKSSENPIVFKFPICPAFEPEILVADVTELHFPFNFLPTPERRGLRASWNAQRWDLRGREVAGVLFFSFLAAHWNIYYHMLEKCHQDKRPLLINKSKLRNNWNPVKFSSNIKTKGTIC